MGRQKQLDRAIQEGSKRSWCTKKEAYIDDMREVSMASANESPASTLGTAGLRRESINVRPSTSTRDGAKEVNQRTKQTHVSGPMCPGEVEAYDGATAFIPKARTAYA